MLVDPQSGRIVGVTPMRDPENNAVVTESLTKTLPNYPNVNVFVMDRVCGFKKTAEENPALAQIKYYSVDWLHAKGHIDDCPCNPYFIGRLSRRLGSMNTSVCEQTFSWFRKYAHSLNQMRPLRHHFMVLQFCARHNELVDRGDMGHLNPQANANASRRSNGSYPCSKRPASGIERPLNKKPASRAA